MPAYIKGRNILRAPHILELSIANLESIQDEALVWQLHLFDYENNSVIVAIKKAQNMYRVFRKFYYQSRPRTDELLRFSERPLDVVVFNLDGEGFNTNCPANFGSPEHLDNCLLSYGVELLHHAYSNGFPEPDINSILKNPINRYQKPYTLSFINEKRIFEKDDI